jgi:outer membrane immunogenic protein
MKKLAAAIAAIALIATPAFAADMAVKAPPPAPAPVPTWTGFYGGIQFGGAWSDEAANYSANDPAAAELLAGTAVAIPASGEQPVVNPRIPQSGLVGGVEAGYNWQLSNWLLGLEADFSLAGMSGTASGTSVFFIPSPGVVFSKRPTHSRTPTGMGRSGVALAGSPHQTCCCSGPVALLMEG